MNSLDMWLPSSLPPGWVIVFLQGELYGDQINEYWVWGVYHLVRYLPTVVVNSEGLI